MLSLHALDQLLPTLCMPPPRSNSQEEWKNWAMWEKKGCASRSPLLASRAGAGAAPPTVSAQHLGQNPPGCYLLLLPALCLHRSCSPQAISFSS